MNRSHIFRIAEVAMWTLVQRHTGRVGYERGVKSEGLLADPPVIDCSGWSRVLLQAAMEAENAASPQPVFQAAAISAIQFWSDRIIQNIEQLTGVLLQGPDITALNLPRCAAIGIKQGSPEWAKNYPRSRGITHIVQVVRRPTDDAAFVSESLGQYNVPHSSRQCGLRALQAKSEWLQILTSERQRKGLMTMKEERASEHKPVCSFGRFLRVRREQLGLTIDEVRSLARRKRLSRLGEIEEGKSYLEGADAAALEVALQLPTGTLKRVRWDETDPAALIASLEEEARSLRPEPGIECTPCCPLCESEWRSAARFHQVEGPSRRAQKGEPCLCGGRRAAVSGVIAIAGALWLAGVRRAVVLGGSSDMDRALRAVGSAKIEVVRTASAGGRIGTTSTLSTIDLVVLARGEVGHKATQNVSQALRALPVHHRPFFLNASSSNISGLAADVLWFRDDIRSHLVNRGAGGTHRYGEP